MTRVSHEYTQPAHHMIEPLFAVFSPLLAAGAAVAAVGMPLVVHLLFRKRYQIVPWAAIRFLLVAERRHKRRIDQWLLLALRALALALFLFAMIAVTPWAETFWQSVRPGAPEEETRFPPTHHVIVIDASLSMTARTDDGQTRFERAVTQAESLIRAGRAGDGYTVLLLAGSVQAVVPGPSNDPERVVAEMRKSQGGVPQVRATHGSADHAAALPVVADILARSPHRVYPRRQVTFFTDLQRASWANAIPQPGEKTGTGSVWEQILSRADVALVDAARDDIGNLAIAELALADPLPLVDMPVTVSAVVVNLSRAERKNVRVDLLLGRPSAGGDALVAVEQKTIAAIPPGGRETVTFELDGPHRFRESGVHVVQVRLTEHDDLPADDSRAIAVEARDGLHALIVDGKAAEADPARRAATQLHRALYPPGSKLSDTPARPRTVTVDDFLNSTVCPLAGVDCVFLCDVPNPTPELAARLDAVLRRGGTVVIGLGPNAAATRADYNAVLYRNGNGVLPGPLGDTVTATGTDATGFRLAADEAEYRKPPLAIFGNDPSRAGLIGVPFRAYVRLDAPPERAHRIFNFARADAPPTATGAKLPATGERPDSALVEYPRHRGRVYVYTSTFNRDWNEWPGDLTFTYLPFWQEFLKHASANPDRHTLKVGEPIEEFFPASAAGLTAELTGPDGLTAKLPVVLRDQAGVARFNDTAISGLYRLGLNGARDRVFAVNVPEVTQGTATESDLTRVAEKDFKPVGRVQIVSDPAAVQPSAESGAQTRIKPKEHGPRLARLAILAALVVLTVELVCAWLLGPSRAGAAGRGGATPPPARPHGRRLLLRLLGTALALVPLAVGVVALVAVFHALATGDPLGFLPHSGRVAVSTALGVPTPAPGEATRWWVGTEGAFFRSAIPDRRAVGVIAAVLLAITLGVYWLERRAIGGDSKRPFVLWLLERPLTLFIGLPKQLVLPALVRGTVILIALYILLPQLRLGFDREGLPEVVILIDVSASMGTVDEFKDPVVRAKAEELARQLADDPDLKDKLPLTEPDRLLLARALLTHKDGDWLLRLLREKEVKVHIYAVGATTRLLTTLESPDDAESGRRLIAEQLIAESTTPALPWEPPGRPPWRRRGLDDASRLGDGVKTALDAFAGKPPAAIIMFTDGVTTAGDDLPKAARAASLEGVPLFLVGVGDPWEPPDLALTDLQAEDSIGLGDTLVFQARLTARGTLPPTAVTVRLKERTPGGGLEERGSVKVNPDPSGNPVLVTIPHIPLVTDAERAALENPDAPGGKKAVERQYVLVADPVAGETDTRNNSLDRAVLVTRSGLIRVLYVEGYPRYDFRFVKVMLERESAKSAGGKSVELKVILLDAAKEWATTDLSAFRGDFPTRTELLDEKSGFDVVILGDVDPKQIPRGASAMRDLVDFVKLKGGGLLFLSGQHGTPAAFADTPLADVLPVIPGDTQGRTRAPEAEPILEGYRPRLTDGGRLHPAFRFSPDPGESARIWNQLPPLYWYATGFRRKPAASVLAVHPERAAEGGSAGELHPLVLQQYVGRGPVLFLGFDDTWRWRYRDNDVQFERFWMQALRALKRAQVRRPEVRVLPKTEFRRDEKVTVQVRFPIDAPAPPGNSVRVTMSRWPLADTDSTAKLPPVEMKPLTLTRVPGPAAQYEVVLPHAPDGRYRFELTDADGPGTPPFATARVLPPLDEAERTDMNRADLIAAANVSGGRFYTIATAHEMFDELKHLQRVPLSQQADPVTLWNQPAAFALVMLLLMTEWLLRKRERLL